MDWAERDRLDRELKKWDEQWATIKIFSFAAVLIVAAIFYAAGVVWLFASLRPGLGCLGVLLPCAAWIGFIRYKLHVALKAKRVFEVAERLEK